VDEAGVRRDLHTLAVRTAKRQKHRHPAEQAAVDGRAVEIQRDGKTAHGSGAERVPTSATTALFMIRASSARTYASVREWSAIIAPYARRSYMGISSRSYAPA
jgi:hypothetical protein